MLIIFRNEASDCKRWRRILRKAKAQLQKERGRVAEEEEDEDDDDP